jgi:hypothetical protein
MSTSNPETPSASIGNSPSSSFTYIEERVRPQLEYFEKKAAFNQGRYFLMRRMMLIASWLTPIAIFLQFTLPEKYRNAWSLVPMILSTTAVGSYQWEEQNNYGTQWSKFRLVAENLKHQLVYFENRCGPFRGMATEEARDSFVDIIERTIEGTDINYFTLMVDPHRGPSEGR